MQPKGEPGNGLSSFWDSEVLVTLRSRSQGNLSANVGSMLNSLATSNLSNLRGPKSPRKGEDSSQQAPLDPQEKQELDQWVKRAQPELGLLKSPPQGVANPQAKAAQHYLSTLVGELAGERLKKDGIDLRVEVFSGDIAQVGLDDSDHQEKTWEKENPGKPWPIRTWLEAPKEGSKPLYRLAVTQGMLETLKTREELAFVVAHQLQLLLSHNIEDPKNEETLEVNQQSFLESRQFQLQNDSAALEMMVDAGINPQGALGALNRLYSKFAPVYSKDDQRAALGAAAKVQEHEGIRFSAMQLQVENLRRTGHPSTAKPISDIPAEIVADPTGEYDSPLDNFAAFQNAMNSVAGDLAGDTTPDWMFGSSSGNPALELLKKLSPDPQDYEKALLGVCEHLNKTSDNPQHRVNGLLRLALALDGRPLPTPFSEAGVSSLSKFLTTNASWNPDSFLQSLSGPKGKSLHRSFAEEVQFNELLQTATAPLATPNSSWAKLAEQSAVNHGTDPETGKFELESLPNFLVLNNAENRRDWPFNSAFNQSMTSVIGSQNPTALAQETVASGLPRGLTFANDMRDAAKHADPSVALELRENLKPIENASNAVREDNARLRLRPPVANPIQLEAYLKGLFTSEASGGFSPAFEAELPALLLDLARTCNHQSDIVFAQGRPDPLDPSLERRLIAMLGSTKGEEKEEISTFLHRNWAHELRVPTQSPRREHTVQLAKHLSGLEPGELVRQLSVQDVSQHADHLKKTLLEGYGLSESALPDASTASLAALEKRVSAGEFEPKEENYQNPDDFKKAKQAYDDRQKQMQELTSFLAPVEARGVLSRLAVLGHDTETSLAAAKKLSQTDFLAVLQSAESTVERAKTVQKVAGGTGLEIVGTDAGTFLIDGFLAVESSFTTIDSFYDMATRTGEISPGAIESRADTRGRMANALNARLEKLDPDQLREWLGKKRVLDTLKPEQTSKLILTLLGDTAKPGGSIEALGAAVADLDKSFKLKEEHGLAYVMMRDSVTESAKLQPGNLDSVFPPEEKGPVDYLAQFRAQLTGLSGLIAMTRNHGPKEQLATIEYLMGRSEEMPKFLERAAEDQALGPVAQTIRNARQSLGESELAVRVMVANSFLAGPNGLLKTADGKEAVLNHFLAGVEPRSLKLARPITQAILVSQGDADSLAVAAVLGQKPKKRGDSSKLTEADILSRVFDSYGVPGIKMKQYLAFTSQFEQYREVFESAQDAANPLNYFETLRLIQNRFGDEWPNDLKVDRVLGSGSVNVAIRYTDEKTGKREVVSLGRQDIVEQTDYDFNRFNKFVDALVTTDEGQQNFGFIKGLINIIKASVGLEFDKESAKAVQKQAFATYKHSYDDGWSVRSIDAYKAQNLGLFMEEAKGRTARKILTEKPELYQQAMRHMAEAEFNLLKGRDASGNLRPTPNFANPDIHDGQVLIDEAAKTVTVLDFGQAVPITNEERELGLDLMTVLGKLHTSKGAAKLLNKRFFPNAKKGEGVQKEDIRKLWKGSQQKMDLFIRLLALVSEKGAEVPLTTVHWILALNRQYVLGEKLDQSIKAQVVGMALSHRVGIGLGTFNTAQTALAKAQQIASSVVSGIAGWVTGWFTDEAAQTGADGEVAGQTAAIGGLKSLAPVSADSPESQARPTEKAWRSKDSWGFYLDDFAPSPEGKAETD